MAQDYTLTAFEVGDFQDPHGNTWCTAVFQGVGEPVKIVVKDPNAYSVGMTLYGDVTEQTSKAGKPYLRFKRAQKEQSFGSKPKYDSDGQKQGMAIKSAADFVTKWADKKLSPTEFAQAVKPYASVLYEMELKGSVVTDSKELSGYEKAKQQQQTLKAKQEPPHTDEDFAMSMSNSLDDGTPINLDDIPF